MGLLDFLTSFQDKYKQSNEIKDFKSAHPEFVAVDDAKLAGALAKKYPDKYGHLSAYNPDASTPPDEVPNTARTKEFYQKNPGVKPRSLALDTIRQVKTKYPEFAEVPDEKLAKALETRYPDRFPKLTELTLNDKHGGITAAPKDTQKHPVKEAIDFLSGKMKDATGGWMDATVFKPDPKRDAAATLALSQMTGLPPHEVMKLSTGERRNVAAQKTGVATQPSNMEFTQGLATMSAALFGAQTPAALLGGVVKLQGLHTAISQAVRAYKGEPLADPAKAAALGEHLQSGNLGASAMDAFSILNDSDISKLASPGATAGERQLLELLQFGAEIGVVHLATPELTARLKAGLADTGKAVVKAAQELPAKAAEIVANASETVKATAQDIAKLPEAIKTKLGEERAFIDQTLAKNPNVTEQGAKELYREFKGFLKNIEAEGGGKASSDIALRQITGGAVDRPAIVRPAESQAKVTDLSKMDINREAPKPDIKIAEKLPDAVKPAELKPITVEHFNQEKAPLPVDQIKVEPELVSKVNELQAKLGKQIGISSGYRTQAYNEDLKKRGYPVDPQSLHLRGRAADIPFEKLGLTQEEVVNAAHEVGLHVEDTALTPHHVHVELPTADSPTKLLPHPLEEQIHPDTVKKLNAAIESKDLPALESILHSDNKVSRQIFERRTGVKLPNGAEATRQTLYDFASPDAEHTRVSDKFYTYNLKTQAFEEAPKAKSFVVEGHQVFVGKNPRGGYSVYEPKSGLTTGGGDTIQAALDIAGKAFKEVGSKKVQETIAHQITRGGLSPRYKVGVATPKPIKTQKEKVTAAVSEKPKDIQTVAKETGILEPNVRRILGVGTKEGVYTRVDKGVYTVTVGDHKLAYIYAADAVDTLPRLASEGFKSDMVFLDIPYDTAAVRGGNRGANNRYNLITPQQFTAVVAAVKNIVRTPDSAVFYMYSQAKSGLKDMERYNRALIDAGFIPVAKGEYAKTYADGSPVQFAGHVSEPEGIILLSQSGNIKAREPINLAFKYVRPKGYHTEKPGEMLARMISMSTDEGDVVLDPFAGSGVTAVEAVKQGRQAVAIEKNPEQAQKIAAKVEAAVPAAEQTPKEKLTEKIVSAIDEAFAEPAPALQVGDVFTMDSEQLSPTQKLVVDKIDEKNYVHFKDVRSRDILSGSHKQTSMKLLTVEREGKLIFKAPEKAPKPLKDFIAEEKAKVQTPETPTEKALKYEEGKRVEPWQVLEADYIEKVRKSRLTYYEKRIVELKALKQTAQIQRDIQALEFWQKKFSTFESARDYGDTRKEYIKSVKNAISKGAAVPQEVIAQYPEFRTARDARERYHKGERTSFGNRTIAVDDTMQAERGYKVKRQDGTQITDRQKKEIADGVDEIEEITGSLKQVFQDADITFAHTNGTNPFMRVAGGLWSPSDNTITIGIKVIGIFPVKAQAHEVGHALDYLAGGVLGKSTTVFGNRQSGGYNRKRLGSITALSESDAMKGESEGGKLIRGAKQLIHNPAEVERLLKIELKEVADNKDEEIKVRKNRISLGDYWDSPREIWARLTEQYIAYKRAKPGVSHDDIQSYYEQDGYWTAKDFARLLPLYEKELARRLDAVRGTKGNTDQAIRAIGAETDAVIEKISKAKQAGGIGNVPSTKRDDNVQGVQSLNPEVEARWKAAEGLKTEGMVAKIWAGIKGIYTQFHEFPELPAADPAYSQIKYDLRILRDLKQIAQDKTLRALNQILFKLGAKKLDLFTRKVILDDLVFEASRGHLLPFGYTDSLLQADHEHISRVVAQNPDVLESIELRRTLLEAVKKDLIDAGIMDAEQFKNTNYFRHQVLEYANARKMLSGSKLKTPNPAYAKRRGGSEMDINTDYIQAEFEWLSQAIKDIEVAKVVERLEKSPLNIKKELQDRAKEQNAAALTNLVVPVEHYGLVSQKRIEKAEEQGVDVFAEGVMADFSSKMAWGFSSLNRLGYKVDQEDGGAAFAEVGRIADAGEGEPEEAQIMARMILKVIADRKKFTKAMLDNKFVVWQDLVPDTHEAWQPKKGNLFFSGKTIPQRLIDKLIAEEGAAVGLSAADLKDVVILGGKLKEFVLPKALVKTIEDTYSTMNQTEVDKLWQLIFREPTTFWKKWILSSPFAGRILSYNFQNMLGDLSAVIGGNPQVVSSAPRAARELWDYYYGQGSVSPELQDAIDRAVLSTELSVQEIPDINHLDVFERFNEKTFADKINIFKMWFAGAAKFSKWREGVLRYAAYLDYLEKQGTDDYGAGIGRAFKYGASDPEQVKGLKDPKDRAAQLSRDLLGDYGAVSPIGVNLRKFLFPFWSWNEVNIKRYKRLFSNARMEGLGGDGGKGRVAGAAGFAMSAVTAAFALRWAFRFAIIYLMQQAWNNLVHPDLEQDISEYDKRRGHVVLGKNSKGEIILRRGQDAFSDFAEWFGLNSLPRLMARIQNHEITPLAAGLEMAKSPVNKFINGINPYVKTGVALMTRRTFFEDFTKPMPVRDSAATVADQFQVRGLYNFIAKKPSRGAKDEVVRTFVTKQDPEENAYNYILQRKGEFKEKMGYGGSGDYFTPRSTLYYEYKKARRLGDEAAAYRAVIEMKKMGVKSADLDRSLAAAKPLFGISKAQQKEFVYKFLTEQDRRKLIMANLYYKKTFSKRG